MLDSIIETFKSLTFRWQDVIDILLVASLIYYSLLLIKGTKAIQMLIGLLVLLLGVFIAQKLHFYTFNWILKFLGFIWVIAFVIVFQPELRSILLKIGQRKLFSAFYEKREAQIYREIVEAVKVMVRKRIGGLIVLEKENSLKNYIETGTRIDSEVTSEIMISIFVPRSPLHDGAIIIKEGKIAAAACVLPVNQDKDLDKKFGMRHRAAMGLTEESDALVVIVSEELKQVSLAMAGKITPSIDPVTLEEMLTLYGPGIL